MALYPGTPAYGENIYLVETTDLVLGGADGVANAPAKDLADRTAYLKTRDDSTIGQISFFARTTPPAHWLACNGARLDRATYQSLFNLYGNRFAQRVTGAGGGATTFVSEDRRGAAVPHGFTTEDLVNLEAFGTAITVLFGGGGSPITPSTDCYVRVISATEFSLHPSAADATANLNAAEQATFTATSWATVEYTDKVSLPDMRAQFAIGADDGLGVFDDVLGRYFTFAASGAASFAIPLLACIKYE